MPLKRRLSLLALIFTLQVLYFPLNRIIEGGLLLKTPLDSYMPFWPVWFIPYLLSLVWWSASVIWATLKMGAELYKTFVLSMVLVLISSYLVFILFPTYVERPVIESSGWKFDLASAVFSNDRANNAFPSGHTYNSVLIAIIWWHWQPNFRWLWVFLAVIVILSTLFTGQHHLVDPIGGILWAFGGYSLSSIWIKKRGEGHSQ